VHIRNPGNPDDRSGDHDDRRTPASSADPASTDDTARSDDPASREDPAPRSVSFRVPTRVVVAKFGVAAVLALVSLVLAAGVPRAVGLIAAAAVAAYALRDVLARERLRADTEGVVAVRGYAERRHLSWPEVERVRVDSRLRLGARTELLELDAGEEIYLFSRYDIGVDPDEAFEALVAIRPDAR
jgi:hypothetical protein